MLIYFRLLFFIGLAPGLLIPSATHAIPAIPANPQAFFLATSPACYGTRVYFTDLSSVPTPPFGYITTWIWDFGDGSPQDTIHFPNSPNISHTFTLPWLTFAVTLKVIDNNGLSDDYTGTVTIIPKPLANFVYAGSCVNQLFHFTDLSQTNGGSVIIGWQWNFADPGSGVNNTSSLQNPSHLFSAGDSTYMVRLIITNDHYCEDTIVKPVYVNSVSPVSISVSASANPVCAGTPVTFTATPVNGGTNPVFQWKVNGLNAGTGTATYTYDPAEGDIVSCSLISNAVCATGNPVTSNEIQMIVNPIPDVTFQPPSLSIPSGQTTEIVLGCSVPGTTFSWIAAAGSPNITGYSSGSNDTIIQTLYNSGSTSGNVFYLVTPSAYGCFGTSSMYTVEVFPALPQSVILQDITVLPGESNCYDALQSISVAGGGTSFQVLPGGSATMVAGKNINYLPGTIVQPGGYLHGLIDPAGTYCGGTGPSRASAGLKEAAIPDDTRRSSCKIYPNPTSGSFTLEPDEGMELIPVRVTVYSMRGNRVMDQAVQGRRTYEFSLAGQPDGLYIIHVTSPGRSETGRLIKY